MALQHHGRPQRSRLTHRWLGPRREAVERGKCTRIHSAGTTAVAASTPISTYSCIEQRHWPSLGEFRYYGIYQLRHNPFYAGRTIPPILNQRLQPGGAIVEHRLVFRGIVLHGTDQIRVVIHASTSPEAAKEICCKANSRMLATLLRGSAPFQTITDVSRTKHENPFTNG